MTDAPAELGSWLIENSSDNVSVIGRRLADPTPVNPPTELRVRPTTARGRCCRP